MGNFAGQVGNLGLQGYGAGLQGLGALQQAAMGQQGYYQQLADTAYQNQLMGYNAPFQALQWLGSLQSMAPLPYTTTNSGTSNTTYQQPQGSLFGQILGGAMTAAGLFGGLAKGGPVDSRRPSGLAIVARRRGSRAPHNGLGVFAGRAA
jgi:hypothetical protein